MGCNVGGEDGLEGAEGFEGELAGEERGAGVCCGSGSGFFCGEEVFFEESGVVEDFDDARGLVELEMVLQVVGTFDLEVGDPLQVDSGEIGLDEWCVCVGVLQARVDVGGEGVVHEGLEGVIFSPGSREIPVSLVVFDIPVGSCVI